MVLVNAAAARDIQRAEAVAQTISHPYLQTQALTALAKHAEPNHARSLIAQAFAVGDWTALLDPLVQIEPSLLSDIAIDYVTATPSSSRVL
jgi:hypothetical protein